MRYFLLIGLLCYAFNSPAQNSYWVNFTDKGNQEIHSGNASEYFTEKALERRKRSNVPFTASDLPVVQSYLDQIRTAEIKVKAKSRWLNAAVVEANPKDLEWLAEQSFVKSLKPVKRLKLHMAELESPSLIPVAVPMPSPSQTFLNYGPSKNQAEMIGADHLHIWGHKGEGMVIAVLDAGFSVTDQMAAFDSLYQDNRVLGTRDFVDGGTDVYRGSTHGTAVLSTMAGYMDHQLIGTAPKASYYLLRTEDAFSESLVEEYNWVLGAEYADSVGADIINSSLGYTTMDDPNESHSYSDMDGNTTVITIGADIAASKGILVVNSAGNSGTGSFFHIGAPSDGDSVIAVGAVNMNSVYTPFSSKGPSADGRVKPDLAAQGQDVVYALTSGGTSNSGAGTSFASPILAGTLACFWQSRPWMSNMDVYDVAIQSAHQFNNPDSLMGYGIPDMTAASGLGIPQAQPEFNLTVYPNPVVDQLIINVNQDLSGEVFFRVLDMRGALIIEGSQMNQNEFRLDFSKFQSGAYLLELSFGDQNQVLKIIK